MIFLRNRLKYALTKDECVRILMQRLVKVDGKARTDPTYPAGFMGEPAAATPLPASAIARGTQQQQPLVSGVLAEAVAGSVALGFRTSGSRTSGSRTSIGRARAL